MDPDTSMEDATERIDPEALLLSSTETRVLELYDQLRNLQVQIALMKAQKDYDGESAISQDARIDLMYLQNHSMKCPRMMSSRHRTNFSSQARRIIYAMAWWTA